MDVEGYYRTLRRARTVRAWKGGGVISHRDAENSITATLGPRMAEIKAADWQALSDKYSGKPGLCWLFSRTPLAHCLRVAESVLWVAFRSVYRLRQVAAGAFGVGRR